MMISKGRFSTLRPMVSWRTAAAIPAWGGRRHTAVPDHLSSLTETQPAAVDSKRATSVIFFRQPGFTRHRFLLCLAFCVILHPLFKIQPINPAIFLSADSETCRFHFLESSYHYRHSPGKAMIISFNRLFSPYLAIFVYFPVPADMYAGGRYNFIDKTA